MSSCDESSCFFDEFNREDEHDESNNPLHNCGSVNGYNMSPKIVDNGKVIINIVNMNIVTISLNPLKN
jgi:hypothetical protein